MSKQKILAPCPRCHTLLAPAGPRWGWRAAELLAWGGMLGSFMLVGALAPITLVGLAPVFLAAGGIVGPLHERATEPRSCPRCRCHLPG